MGTCSNTSKVTKKILFNHAKHKKEPNTVSTLELIIVLVVLFVFGFIMNLILPNESQDGAIAGVGLFFLFTIIVFPNSFPFGFALFAGFLVSGIARSHDAITMARASKMLDALQNDFGDLLRRWKL
ncbi:MAG: hypothetical protein HY711_10210 [Candidatus Melainabacteria bacterium]|nr:hypothetical protein [Candidatus Melainabacteria bacterium]